jgi:hypothetical protein
MQATQATDYKWIEVDFFLAQDRLNNFELPVLLTAINQ